MIYDLEQLYTINIHDLRNLAREIGVKAPTSLKKKALIHEIIQIKSGEKQPCVVTKRGRPPKGNGKAEKKAIKSKAINVEKNTKKELIDRILREIERKLYKLL